MEVRLMFIFFTVKLNAVKKFRKKEGNSMKKLMAILMCMAVVAFVGKVAFADDDIRPTTKNSVATKAQLKLAREILGVKVKYGIATVGEGPQGVPVTTTTFYGKDGVLVGTEVVHAAFFPGRGEPDLVDNWYDAKGNLVPVAKLEADNLGGDTKVYQEFSQRKAAEAQIELKGNGRNYTISPQLADAPKEGVQLQKKQ